jgi:hypothetical protein
MGDSFRRALSDATKELESLTTQRVEIEEKIRHLKQLIRQLAAVSGDEAGAAALASLAAQEGLGLTGGVRAALKQSRQWKTAGEVRQILISLGYDLSKYANSSAIVYTILNRLVQQGSVERDDSQSAGRYRWYSSAEEKVSKAMKRISRKKSAKDL